MHFTQEDLDDALKLAEQIGREKVIAALIQTRPEWEDEIKRIVGEWHG